MLAAHAVVLDEDCCRCVRFGCDNGASREVRMKVSLRARDQLGAKSLGVTSLP